MDYERQMLQQQIEAAELKTTSEKAAKKVVQQILAEDYRREIEQKRQEKYRENEQTRQRDVAIVNQIMNETEPEVMKEKLVRFDKVRK